MITLTALEGVDLSFTSNAHVDNWAWPKLFSSENFQIYSYQQCEQMMTNDIRSIITVLLLKIQHENNNIT